MKFKSMALLLILIILSSSCAFSVDNSSNKNNKSLNNKISLTGNLTNTIKLQNDTRIYVNPSNGNDENNGLTPDKPKKSIRNAVENAVENGIICLAEGTYNDCKTDSISWPWAGNPEENNTGSIIIDKNITIVGKDAIIHHDYFCISQGKTVSIYGITFENCSNSVISSEDANLTIKNSKFQNKNVKNGSSIYKMGGNLELSNCQFINNIGENGPALNINNGTTHVLNCKFDYNIANEDGGAIYNGDDLNIEKSQFSNNKAQQNGGAIFLKKGKNIIYNCTLTANSAYSGGSIQNLYEVGSNNDSECKINNCTFNTNRGTVGGAVNNKGYFSVKESIITNNYAYCGGFIDNWGTCTIDYCSITNNTASGGGAVGNIGNMNIHFCILTENSANCGFAILNENGCIVNATDNWWGSNPDPKDLIYGEVSYDPILTSSPNIPNTTITKQQISKKLNTTKITVIK